MSMFKIVAQFVQHVVFVITLGGNPTKTDLASGHRGNRDSLASCLAYRYNGELIVQGVLFLDSGEVTESDLDTVLASICSLPDGSRIVIPAGLGAAIRLAKRLAAAKLLLEGRKVTITCCDGLPDVLGTDFDFEWASSLMFAAFSTDYGPTVVILKRGTPLVVEDESDLIEYDEDNGVFVIK